MNQGFIYKESALWLSYILALFGFFILTNEGNQMVFIFVCLTCSLSAKVPLIPSHILREFLVGMAGGMKAVMEWFSILCDP